MAEHDEWSRDRNELDNKGIHQDPENEHIIKEFTFKRSFIKIRPNLTDEEIADANDLSKELQATMYEHLTQNIFSSVAPSSSTQKPFTLDELDHLVRELERTLPPKEESLGCLVVDPWMLGEPMVLTYEAQEDFIRLLFGDSAEQIIEFRKRHLPRLTVVTSRETWEKFRAALLKDKMKEESSSVWGPHLRLWPASFDGAPVYTVEEPPMHGRFLELSARAESMFFLQHNPSLLLQKLEEARARNPQKESDQ